MLIVSRDTPFLYLTAVAKDRLPVFRTETIQRITCAALAEARASGGFALLAYVVMPDHLHWITGGPRSPSDTLRFVKGIVSRRVIGWLKEQGHEASLRKLRHQQQRQRYEHSLWEHHSNVLLLTSEALLMQKVRYLHANPVRAGLVQRAEEYRWSSARIWLGRPAEDEPLPVDIDQIRWHRPAGRGTASPG